MKNKEHLGGPQNKTQKYATVLKKKCTCIPLGIQNGLAWAFLDIKRLAANVGGEKEVQEAQGEIRKESPFADQIVCHSEKSLEEMAFSQMMG